MDLQAHLDTVIRLRRLYRRRGPKDGKVGITPEGKIDQAARYSLLAVAGDADEAMRKPSEKVRWWRSRMGLDT